MASVRKIKRKFGDVYRAEICIKGRRESATFDLKSEAVRWGEETEHLLRNGLPLPGELPDNDMTIEAATDKYYNLLSVKKKPNTQRTEAQSIKRLLNYFAGKTLLSISSADIASFRDYRLTTVGPSSVLQDLSFLKKMYNTARIEWGVDAGNPAADVKGPPPPRERIRLLGADEIEHLITAAKKSTRRKNLADYVMIQLHTAMRPSEGARLKWNQVKWDAQILDLTITKTDPRRVPLTPKAFALLKEMYEKAKDQTGGVFLSKEERQYFCPSDCFKNAFRTASRKAGVEHVTLYGLRHTAASHLIMNGVDIRVIADIMGHRSISTTMKYTHLLDNYKLKAIKKLNWIGPENNDPEK